MVRPLIRMGMTNQKLQDMNVYACHPPASRRLRTGYIPSGRQSYPNPALAVKPAVNIIRTENGHLIDMALPGLSKEQVAVEVKDNFLRVRFTGEKPVEEGKFLRKEFNFNGFERKFRLPENADTAAIEARFEAGILRLAVPDRKPVVRPIEIS